jgi:hypothetical protein
MEICIIGNITKIFESLDYPMTPDLLQKVKVANFFLIIGYLFK